MNFYYLTAKFLIIVLLSGLAAAQPQNKPVGRTAPPKEKVGPSSRIGYNASAGTNLTQEQLEDLQKFWSKVEGAFGNSNGSSSGGGGGGYQPQKEELTTKCLDPSFDCVPYFQCVNGVINTDGEGLIDIRIRPQATCSDPDYPDVPAVCCRKPGQTGPITSQTNCSVYEECVDHNQCSQDGYIVTDGSGLIDLRNLYKTCQQENGKPGRCCKPPPTTVDKCPAKSACIPAEECQGQALDSLNKFIKYVKDGSWSQCSLKSNNRYGVCCIQSPSPIIELCPANSKCIYPLECLGNALDLSNNFVPCVTTGSYLQCSYNEGGKHKKGVCCIPPPPKIIEQCPASSFCIYPLECLGKALDISNNFVPYVPTGSYLQCSYDEGVKHKKGICCIPSPSKIIDQCPTDSVCLDGGSCVGNALDDKGNIIPYDSKLSSWSQCNLGPDSDSGVCCFKTQRQPDLHPAAQCGIRNYHVDQRIMSNYGKNEAAFGEFPWQAIIFFQNYTFRCGASLISNRHVVTAAHCVNDYHASDIRLRFGEWRVNKFDEPLPYEDRNIHIINIHPKFNAKNAQNDIAVLELERPLKLQYHINTICLPDKAQEFHNGDQCLATGWGKDSFEGKFQSILKKIDLPFVEYDKCQTWLRKTRLGKNFELDKFFVCAGGEENKDACYGDGGGPLICKNPATGQYVLAGVTSWGIGCGTIDVPGVYVNVQLLSSWVDEIVKGFKPNADIKDDVGVVGYGK